MNSWMAQQVAQQQQLRSLLPGEAPWLQQQRAWALERFSQMPLPTRKDEAWKHTPMHPLKKVHFEARPPSCLAMDLDDLHPFLGSWQEGNLLTFVNGRFTVQLSRLPLVPHGVYVGSLGAMLASQPEKVEPYLRIDPEKEMDPFQLLELAYLMDGAFIHLEEGFVMEQPLHLLYLNTPSHTPVLHPLHNLIVAERRSGAQIVEHHVSLSNTQHDLTLCQTDIHLHPGVIMDHGWVQQISHEGFHLAQCHVQQCSDSHFNSHAFAVGGALSRYRMHVNLKEEGTQCTLRGLYTGDGHRHVDMGTKVNHAFAHGQSSQLHKGMLCDHAHGVFDAMVKVHPHAAHTHATQRNDTLLLSEYAVVESQPQMEILADDVQCSHGATVGQLDEEALFYLQSRGIARMEAQNLLIEGFLEEVVGDITSPILKPWYAQCLQQTAPTHQGV
ncbi:Fe-S cluster assembly protein SufD [Magnetococcus sp. PR-3]|uniref:Fe-S cluster assembly protein SufD n=1 Tax=Magnetococcus sp. PR-3 TaxID=3120355 RepID=UPI002FCE1280